MDMLPLFAESITPPTDEWQKVFFGFDQDQRFALMIVAIGCLTGIICTIVGCLTSAVTSTQRNRTEADLKRELIDRGMTADEIAQVVEAAPPKHWLERWANAQSKRKK